MRKPASEEITSVSVQLCETEVCFLHIELLGTNVRLPKIQRIFPGSISNLQSLQQSLGLKVSCSDLVIYMSLHQCLQLLTTRHRLIWIDFVFVKCQYCFELITLSYSHLKQTFQNIVSANFTDGQQDFVPSSVKILNIVAMQSNAK